MVRLKLIFQEIFHFSLFTFKMFFKVLDLTNFAKFLKLYKKIGRN